MYYTNSWLGSRKCIWGDLYQDTHLYLLRGNYEVCKLDIRMKQWTKHKWNADYLESTSRVCAIIPRVSSRPLGMSLPRTSRVRVSCLRTGVRCFHLSMYKWGLTPSPNCKRDTTEQTADHVISSRLIHHAPRGLQVLDDAI